MTKIVFQQGDFRIVRVQSYGFRSNGLSNSWELHRADEYIGNFIRLKDAKRFLAHMTA